MDNLALILLGPWLLILAWAYWTFPRSLPRTRGRRLVDVSALLLAVIAAVGLAHYGYTSTAKLTHLGNIGVWQMVAPVLYAYGGFSVVLALGMTVRHAVWHRSCSENRT